MTCGPGDGADDLRLHAEVAERLEQAGGDLLLTGGVGADLLGTRARQQARLRQAPLEARVVGDRRAVATLGCQLRRVWRVATLRRLGQRLGELAILVRRVQFRADADLVEIRRVDRRRLDVGRADDQLAVLGLRWHQALGLAPCRGGCRPTCSCSSRYANAAVADRRRERAAGEQDDAGEREEDGEDVGAGRADQARGRPQLRLAEDAAVRPEVAPPTRSRARGPLPASASALAAKSRIAPARNGLTVGISGRISRTTPAPASATGMPSRASPISQARPLASESPTRPPSQCA